MNLFALLVNLDPLNWDNIRPAFEILWKGLVAIFVVIAVIIVVVRLVDFCLSKAEAAKKRREETAKSSSSPNEKPQP